MIEVSSLTKEYEKKPIVKKLNFSVKKGEVLAFLGPNGAGKTTTMKMIVGAIFPTSGTVTIDNHDIQLNTIEAQKKIGYLPESTATYGEMTVYEFLTFIADVRRIEGSKRSTRLERVQELCSLHDVWHQPIETLSKGYRQRVGFAQALIHDPPVLILDEPTDGLDPNQKHEVRKLIRQMGETKTIILSTHILEEVEGVCSRVIIINNGEIAIDTTPDLLIKKSKFRNSVLLSVANKSNEEVKTTLQKNNRIERLEVGLTGSIRIFPKADYQIATEIANLAKEYQWQISEFSVDRGRIEDVFRALTSGL